MDRLAPGGERGSGASPRVAVLIPALDEEATIGEVVAAVPRVIAGAGVVDVIVVDDGSRDATRARAIAAGADRVISHPCNRGLVASFKDGVNEALGRGADILVNLDGDGQHDPADIPRLIAPLLEGRADMVLGVRPLADAKATMTPVRRHGNRIGSWVTRRAIGMPVTDATSGYRAFSREALLRLNVISDYTYTLETLIQASRKRLTLAEVPVPSRRRQVGESRMTRSVGHYIRRTGAQAVRSMLQEHPLAGFGRAAMLMMAVATACAARFVWGYHVDPGLHLPALLGAVIATVIAVGLFVTGLIADGINANRRLMEDALLHIRRLEASSRPAPAHAVTPVPALVAAPVAHDRPRTGLLRPVMGRRLEEVLWADEPFAPAEPVASRPG